MNSTDKSESREGTSAGTSIGAVQDFVSMTVGGQLFGIPVLKVQDILGPQRIWHIPLAPMEVSGSLNLRGRIVTAVDVRLRLGLPGRGAEEQPMSVVVESRGEPYSLLVDQVGEVMSLKTSEFERNPPTLDVRWREYSEGIYRLDGTLLIVLNVARLLELGRAEAA